MTKEKLKLFLVFIIGLLTAYLIMFLLNKNNLKDTQTLPHAESTAPRTDVAVSKDTPDILSLTAEKTVIHFVKTNHQLPEYYLTKNEARKMGWVAAKGNLCDVLPGKAIGGDRFSNRERSLPKGVEYFEADVNYTCGNRNADRIVFTKNGAVYLTKDHYQSFQKQ